jgi:TonB family protein
MKHLIIILLLTAGYKPAFAQLLIIQDPDTGLKGMQHQKTGAIVIPTEYEDISTYYWLDSVIVVLKDGWKGAFNPSGQLTVPIKYRDIRVYKPDRGYTPGYVMLTSEGTGKRHFGLYKLGQGLVLPEQFETVAPVFPDLLVGRVYMDTILQFFSGEGKPLFNLPGMAVKNTIGGKVMEIEKRNHESWFLYKNGKPVLPETVVQPVWTVGHFIITGQFGKMSLITLQGDSILPQPYHRIQALGPDRFVVYTDNYHAGLIDDRGQWLIPIAKQSVYSAYPDTNSIIVSRSSIDFNDKIYDRNGQVLLSGFRYETYHADRSLLGVVPEQYPEKYFWARMAGSQKVGLYVRENARQIVPPEYQYIFYGSEHHVLIANTRRLPPDNRERYTAYDLEGKVVLPPAYAYLRYTRDPNVLIGKPDTSERLGFIRLDKPYEARFEYLGISDLYDQHYAARVEEGFVVLGPDGKKRSDIVFTALEHPKFPHIKMYEENHSEYLVAVGTRAGTPKGVWFGMNNKGEVLEFPPLPEKPEEQTAVEEEVAVVVDAPRPPEFSKATTGQGSGPAYETVVEKGDTHPQFPGGEPALKKFLSDNLRYPAIARENRITGRVVVTFVVETDGSISSPNIIKDIGGGCGKEALRLISAMPKWQPGTTGGKPVRAKFTLPVEFKL